MASTAPDGGATVCAAVGDAAAVGEVELPVSEPSDVHPAASAAAARAITTSGLIEREATATARSGAQICRDALDVLCRPPLLHRDRRAGILSGWLTLLSGVR